MTTFLNRRPDQPNCPTPHSNFNPPRSKPRFGASPWRAPRFLPKVLLAELILGAIGIALLSPKTFGFAEIAKGSLRLQTTASGVYDSYFIGTESNDPDYYFSVQPMLQYARRGSRAGISADGGVNFTRYLDNTQYDSSDIIANLNIDLPTSPGARLDGSVSASYTESTIVDYFLNDRIPTRSLVGRISFNYQLSQKTSLTEAFNYTKLYRDEVPPDPNAPAPLPDPTTNGQYSDQQVWSNRLTFRYADFLYGSTLSLDYAYTNTQSDGNNYLGVPLDQYDNAVSLGLTRPIYGTIKGYFNYGYHILNRSAAETYDHETQSKSTFFTIGVNGPFLPPSKFPKITSSAAIYYQESQSKGINDTTGRTLTGDLSLSWQARPRTQIAIFANRSMELNAADISVTSTRAGMTITESVGLATTIVLGGNYRWSDYNGIDRQDSFFDVNLSINHSLNKYWSASASYEYQKNNNSSSGSQPTRQPGRDYDRQLVTLSIVNTF